jgi:transposase
MAKKRTYSTQTVEGLEIEVLIPALVAGCIVALDVAKQKFVFAIATLAGEVLKLVRFEHPTQTRKFLDVVAALRQHVEPGKLRVAMEPTGTYGDAIRYQLQSENVPVWMVSPKKTFDSRALFDDVQSLHDPKSAVHVAKLCSMNLATEWHAPPELRIRLRALVELRGHEFDLQERCFGRMEAVLARHWPEFAQWLDVRTQKSALALLASYPSAARVEAAPSEVASLLGKVSRGHLAEAKICGIIQSATATLGVPPTREEERLLKTLAEQAAAAARRAEDVERELSQLGRTDEAFKRLEGWMGTFTAAAIVTLCDPRQYASAGQFEKACGLNLREKSSGNDRRDLTPLHITKRGPSLLRKLLYLFALRMISSCPEVRAWYMRRHRYTTAKTCAVIAVMRKLLRAVFHVARGSDFDPTKLFDVRRLELAPRAPAGVTLPPRARKISSPANTSLAAN